MSLIFEENAVEALKIMENTNECLYLTGVGWSWKSTLINYFISKTKKTIALLWTTWVAAEMIWGETIHRFFWLKPWSKPKINKSKMMLINEIHLFIIDEVSMLRADLFDLINNIMKKVCGNDKFFWWKQFIFVWDLFQLPPVGEREEELKQKYNKLYSWLFFFNWNTYKEIKKIQLNMVHRQKDITFINNLNKLRIWCKDTELLNYFNKKVINKKDINKHSILIGSTNYIVNNYNKIKIDELRKPLIQSYAYISWDFPQDIYPVDRLLEFKVWARIMFIINNKDLLYVNWTLWTIINIMWTEITIEKDDWHKIKIWKYQWHNYDWIDEFWNPIIVWTFLQYPFKIAFGITCHKSQWKTFDNIVIDLWKWAFSPWQTYVALSRATSYEGIQLLQPLKLSDIQIDFNVMRYIHKNTLKS